MERILPMIKIGNTDFVVDIAQCVLREKDDPQNTLSFHDMKDMGDHYTFLYDPKTKYFGDTERETAYMEQVKIPQMVALDPEGMALKHGLTKEFLEGKNDHELLINEALLDLRLKGVLPKIDVAGQPFIIDYRLKELRAENAPDKILPFSKMDMDEDGQRYLFFYHPESKQLVPINKQTTEVPEGLVLIDMPNELGLDPVAVARENGITDSGFLRRYPPQKDMKAKVTPAANTNLKSFIKQNRERISGHRPQGPKLT